MSAKENYSQGSNASWAIFLSLTLLLSKFFGFFKEMLIAKYFGATAAVDAYRVAILVPQIASGLLVSGLGLAFVPVFTEYLSKRKEREGWAMIKVLTSYLLILLFLTSLGGIVFAPQIINVVAPGFLKGIHGSAKTYNLSVLLLRLTMPYFLFSEFGGFIQAVLQSYRKYTLIIWWQIIPNAILLFIIIVFGKQYGIIPLALGFTFIGIAYFLFLLPGILHIWRSKGISLRKPFLSFTHPGATKVMQLFLPVILASSVMLFAQVIDNFLASYLEEGSIAVLSYAYRLVLFPVNIFVSAFTFVVFPLLAFSSHKGEKEFKKAINSAMRMVLFLCLPPLSLFILLSLPITRIVYERSSFGPADTLRVASVLRFYSIGIVAWGVTEVLNRTFFSVQNTKVPLTIGAIASIFNVLGSIFFVRFLGVNGLALASALAVNFNMLVLFILLKKDGKVSLDKSFYHSLFSLLISTVAAGMVVYLLLPYFETPYFLNSLEGRIFSLGFLFFLFIIAYLMGLYLLKNEEAAFLYWKVIFPQLEKYRRFVG